ncbi:Isochorismate hydrolase [Actinopolyspora xinjiangensis]|uniref:Isochorismate hydrolase n=1 Tax=Actinopolyspora xinjiangensis TaxID=405564 RepID=A0A1H0W274_9ACTN|nr:isochorismatase family protein [Actinopolyspora xinjiangensis]SDP84648.1 Isochorismate hydrolase [Actinopolyspora xinjiangensis]
MTGIPTITPYPMPTGDDLPANTAPWTVDPDRAVLLVHDMQRYFLKPLPSDREPGRSLVDNIVSLRNSCSELGVPVAYTAQPGDMTTEQRGLLQDFWGPGMSGGPEDRELVEPLAPREGDRVFTKWRYSAFFASDLLAMLRESGRDQLLLCGVYAHVGVLMSAVDAFTNDIQPFLVADAVADFSPEYHRMAVDYAAARCAVVTTTASVNTELHTAEVAL